MDRYDRSKAFFMTEQMMDLQPKYHKILIYYFTGTGHTAYLVNMAKTEFEKYGVQVDVVEVTDLTDKSYLAYDNAQYDLIGFSYPIHGFRCPANMYAFVKKLAIANKPYFILKNSREWLEANNASSLCLIRQLRKKKCTFLREEHMLLPYNIHFRHDDRLVKQMLLALDSKVPAFVANVLQGNTKPLRCSLMARFCATFVGRTEWFGTRLIGATFHADQNCVGCGICAKQCPQHNIVMQQDKDEEWHPHFKKDGCITCMRCVMHCPKSCITIRHFLKGWEVYGKYDFTKIKADDTISPDFITPDYKGAMAHSYKQYFFDQDRSFKI